MNVQEKTLARILFKNKIYKSDGQAFEDIFTQIMNYSEENFKPIKPWGNIGDRKNDGYIKSKGIFYQVYAPEDICISYLNAVKKLETDFKGLLEQWYPVNEFYFVINDKYKGVNADCENKINEIEKVYSLKRADILTAKDIENILFSLDDDQIFSITGSIPDPAAIKVDYSILNEVIKYIMELPLQVNSKFDIEYPDWDEKIKFNNLTDAIGGLLYNAYTQIETLEKYLSNNGDFIADSLRDKLNKVYSLEKTSSSGDALFLNIVNRLSPKATITYQNIVIIIMAKYFESCDIFEKPLKEGE